MDTLLVGAVSRDNLDRLNVSNYLQKKKRGTGHLKGILGQLNNSVRPVPETGLA